MRKLSLPKGALGRDYVLVPLMFGEEGPFDFMLDSGLTGTIVTPALCKRLGIDTSVGEQVVGAAAGGEAEVRMIRIENVSIAGGTDLQPLHGAVTDFVQEHLDPAHDVQGMLGIEFLRQFDVEINFEREMLRFHQVGDGMKYAQMSGMKEVQGALLPAELMGVRVSLEGGPPFLGIVDLGASFTTVNWKAAMSAGVTPQDSRLNQAPRVYGLGIDGRPIVMPQLSMRLALDGAYEKSTGRFPELVNFDAVSVCIGDISVFQDLLSLPGKKFDQAAGLIGLDVLSQCRCLLINCQNWKLYVLE